MQEQDKPVAEHQMGGAWNGSLSHMYLDLGAQRSEVEQRGPLKALALGLGWERALRGFLVACSGAEIGGAMGVTGFPLAAHSRDPHYL